MDDNSGNLTPFELERLANIKRNEEVLASLGLYSLLPVPKPKRTVTRKRKDVVQTEASRKSRRLLGLVAEHRIQDEPCPGEEQNDIETRPPRRSPPKLQKEATKEELNDLNKYRTSYMSEDALRRRIGAIKRIDKMESFIQILKAEGRDELATAAENALHKLKAHR